MDFSVEIVEAWSVDEVDLLLAPLSPAHAGNDGHLLFDLIGVEVEATVAFIYALQARDRLAGVKNALAEGRFAGALVAEQGDVSDVLGTEAHRLSTLLNEKIAHRMAGLLKAQTAWEYEDAMYHPARSLSTRAARKSLSRPPVHCHRIRPGMPQ